MAILHLTEAQVRRLAALSAGKDRSTAVGEVRERRKNKYRNEPCYDERFGTNEWFQSKWEREVWYLRMLQQQAGEIRDLRRQVKFPIRWPGSKRLLCTYIADQTFEELQPNGEWHYVVEDAKGKRTGEYRLKAKLIRECYGIKIRETRRER